MNRKRIARLADVIEVESKHFNMSNWVGNRGAGNRACGTTGCIAGFAVAEFHSHLWEDYADAFEKLTRDSQLVPGNGHIATAACELLDLTPEQEDRIFYINGWPLEYREAYSFARNDQERAEVAVSYLRAIASGKVKLGRESWEAKS